MEDDRRRVGLLGCGTVGSQVARLLVQDPRLRSRFSLAAVAVHDIDRARPAWMDPSLLTTDPVGVATGADVDIVIEVMGGLEPAGEAITRALELGRPVVTANKALLAERGSELRTLAERCRTAIRYEAAVAAGVPVLGTLSDVIRTDHVTRIEAVLNGTSNFVLCEMERSGITLAQAVAQAQQRGYAEADPSRDLDGTDAADKLAILAQLIWGTDVTTSDVQRLGIGGLTPDDLRRAREAGRTWRLVAAATPDGCLVVEPRQLPVTHRLAQVEGADNVVVATTAHAGRLVFAGPGAGGLPTASAVVADAVRISSAGHRTAAQLVPA